MGRQGRARWLGAARPDSGAGRAHARVADAERRLEALRDSELARLLEESLAASLRGEDLLAELRARWAAALADARARLAGRHARMTHGGAERHAAQQPLAAPSRGARMQPSETAWPMLQVAGVPWMARRSPPGQPGSSLVWWPVSASAQQP